MIRRIALAVLIVLVVASILPVAAAPPISGAHYLNGQACQPEKDPVAQYYRYRREMWRTRTELGFVTPQPIGAGITVKWDLYGKNTAIVLRDYSPATDGGAVFYGQNGLHRLSAVEIATVVADLQATVKQAVDLSYDVRKGLTASSIKILSRAVGEDVRPFLFTEADPALKGLTTADILGVPLINRELFVPDVLFFASSPYVWGQTFLTSRFGGRRLIFYETEGRVFDCLFGKPLVLVHEMLHANPMLEPLPEGWQFDVELWAALEEFPNPFSDDFLKHPYLQEMREIALAFFGFDARRVRSEIVDAPTDWGLGAGSTIYLNEEKYRKYHADIQRIGIAITEFTTEALFPEFYADAVFGLGVNMQLCQQTGFVDVAAASYWELAGLGGPNETRAWLSENEQNIRDLWYASQDDTGKPTPEALKALGPGTDWSRFCPDFGFYVSSRGERPQIPPAVLQDYKEHGMPFVFRRWMEGGYR